MGRHADPDTRHFWRSLAAAVAKATLALGVVVGLFAAVSTIGGGIPEDGPVMLGGPDTLDDGALPEGPEEVGRRPLPPEPSLAAPPSPAPLPDTESAEDTENDAAEADQTLLAAAPAPEETRVQVLDGVNDPGRLAELVGALESLGYQVVATNPASTDYDVTTVLYSEGREPAARALQVRDPRVAALRPSPGLSDQVDLHVVLGADWSS